MLLILHVDNNYATKQNLTEIINFNYYCYAQNLKAIIPHSLQSNDMKFARIFTVTDTQSSLLF